MHLRAMKIPDDRLRYRTFFGKFSEGDNVLAAGIAFPVGPLSSTEDHALHSSVP